LATIIEEPQGLADNMIYGANRPGFKTFLDILFNFIGIGELYFWLFIVRVQDWGIQAMFWWIPLNGFPIAFIQLVIKWWFINREICPVRFNKFGWQAFIAPIIPSLLIAGVAQIWLFFVFPPIVSVGESIIPGFGTIISGAITILFAFIGCLMFMFFPLYTAFGGNDVNTLAIFHEACMISGPSRFLFLPIDKMMSFLGKKSPLHNKFPIPWKEAEQEAMDLMQERYVKDKIAKIIKEKGIEIKKE
jgi:hypothetical protein